MAWKTGTGGRQAKTPPRPVGQSHVPPPLRGRPVVLAALLKNDKVCTRSSSRPAHPSIPSKAFAPRPTHRSRQQSRKLNLNDPLNRPPSPLSAHHPPSARHPPAAATPPPTAPRPRTPNAAERRRVSHSTRYEQAAGLDVARRPTRRRPPAV